MFFSEIIYHVVSRLIVQFITQLKKYKFFPSKVYCEALSKLFIYLIANLKNDNFYSPTYFFLSNPFVTLINHFEKVRFSLSIGGLVGVTVKNTQSRSDIFCILCILCIMCLVNKLFLQYKIAMKHFSSSAKRFLFRYLYAKSNSQTSLKWSSFRRKKYNNDNTYHKISF